jgi:nondiscriminating glutamyl-tRNA synthetase
VRFAPSPTGYLHVGGARTALFNWLFARHHGGTFILRVEDTDSARYKPEFVAGIYDALRWLRIGWDEGPDVGGPHAPYVQSERVAIHRAAAARLLADGRAYECFCGKTASETAEPADDDTEGPPAPQPACACGAMSAAQAERARAGGGAAALRFRTDPSRAVKVDDLIRGPVTFPPGTIGDFIFVKSDGTPLYNFAATCDDHVMEITHVIRGEEHLANAPKQLLIYEALGWEPPAMAHLPIILNEQRRKLSKRDGATFVNDYEALGYLPEAIVNFLALLGWSPGDDRELMTVDEMIRDFRIEDVVKHPAIFDVAKLSWMNKEYVKALPPQDAASRVTSLLAKRLPAATRTDMPHVARVTALLLERVRTLADVVDQGAYFFVDGPVEPNAEALAKHCAAPETAERLKAVREALTAAPGFEAGDVESAIRGLAERTGAKAASFIHPLRVALTGVSVSPGIFEVAAILGREAATARIDALLSRLALKAQASSKAVPS